MRIYFVRHGETSWNSLGRLLGESDIPLNSQGETLADMTGEALSDVVFEAVFSSPYIRALQTAERIIRGKNIPVFTDERIREITWGEWDGLTADQIAAMGKKKEFDLFYTDPFKFKGAPGGETIRQVCSRGKSFLDDLLSRGEFAESSILVITHGCAVRGILNHLYENPDDFWQEGVPPNCAVNIVEEKSGTLEFLEKDRIYYDKSLVRNYYTLQP